MDNNPFPVTPLKHTNFSYTTLAKIDPSSKDAKRCFFYAIIYDASSPYGNVKNKKPMCTLKIFDNSLWTKPFENTPCNLYTLCIFSRNISKLPQILNIGSIIRIHRSEARNFHGSIMINCDLDCKASATVFPGNSNDDLKHDQICDEHSLKSFNKNYISIYNSEKMQKDEELDKTDIEIIDNLRMFLNEVMASCIFFKDASNLFSSEEKRKDFDVLCMVWFIKENKERNVLKIKVCDHTKISNVYLPLTSKFKLKSGDFIRIRSGSYIESSITKIRLDEYSNILLIPLSKTTQQIENKIRSNKNPIILLNYYISQNMLNNKVITEIINYHDLDRNEILKKNIKETLMNNQFAILKGTLINVEMVSYQSKCRQMIDIEEVKIKENDINNIEIQNEFKFEINVPKYSPIIASTFYYPEFFKPFFPLMKGNFKENKNCEKKIFKLLNRLVKESNCNMELLIFKQEDIIYIKDTILKIEF